MATGMRAPSTARLLATFKDLDQRKATLIRALAHAVDDPIKLASVINGNADCRATEAYARSCYSDPYDSGMWRRTLALHAIDTILGTHGVEPLGNVSLRDGPPYEYCNAGDPYVATLIYTRDTDTLRIGCWGDIVERDSSLSGAQ